jgi:hypothetical protein
MLEKEPFQNKENIDAMIDKKMAGLYERFNDMELTPELDEEWYWVEMQVLTSKDRDQALVNLEEFIKKLEDLKNKE